MGRKTGYLEQHEYWESVRRRRPPDHPVVRAFAESKLDLILEVLPQFTGRTSMLEVGAGNGFFSLTFEKAFDLTCLDFSMNMLEMNPLPRRRKIVGDAEKLQFKDNSFDLVFSGNLLHHLEDPYAAVSEMARVARCHVVLIEPNALNPLMFLFGAINRKERGTLKFTPSYLKTLGRRAGLHLRVFKSQGVVLPNKTPRLLLPALRPLERTHPLGFYHIAIFDVS